MHVAVIVSGLGAGGAERVVALLTKNWIERGWRVSVICLAAMESDAYHAFPSEVRVVRRPTEAMSPTQRFLDIFGRIGFLRRTIRRERPDVVVSFLTKINVLALLANFGSDMPLVICERNNPERQNVRIGWRYLQNLLARRATLVLQTEASRRAFPDALLGRVRVIPNPMRPTSFEADPDRRTVVAAGRLVDQKGFDLLIDAFAAIAPAHPGWSLVIWGEGPLREALWRRILEKGLEGRATLPGNSAQPQAWLRSGSIFALSSRYEGFPNVLLEAMSAGMAVAAFDCAFGPAEIVRPGEDGLLVRREDVGDLAASLDRLMRDDALRRGMGEAARRNVERFSLERIARQWDEALRGATRDRAGRSRRLVGQEEPGS